MDKTRLQEFCLKNRWALPSYETRKEGPDHQPTFTANVTVNGQTFASPSACLTKKNAENMAAFAAYQHFIMNGVLPVSIPSIGRIYKPRLQMYSQRRGIHLPVYSSTRIEGPDHAPRFTGQVIIDGRTFQSSDSYFTTKDAEEAAAKAALRSGLYGNVIQQSPALPPQPAELSAPSIPEAPQLTELAVPPTPQTQQRSAREARTRRIVIAPRTSGAGNIEGGNVIPWTDGNWMFIELPPAYSE